MQALIISDRVDSLRWNHITIALSALTALFLCIITVHGIIGLLEIRFTQAQIRNKIFLLLGGKSPYHSRRGFGPKARYYFAKVIALYPFLSAVMVAIVSPAIFVSSVIVNEIITWDYLISERTDAVGQVSRSQRYLRTARLTAFSGVHGLAPRL